MPEPQPSTPDPIDPEITGPEIDPEPTPGNRAARRGKSRDQAPAAARYRGSAGPSRPAQGRRINPVRRTG